MASHMVTTKSVAVTRWEKPCVPKNGAESATTKRSSVVKVGGESHVSNVTTASPTSAPSGSPKTTPTKSTAIKGHVIVADFGGKKSKITKQSTVGAQSIASKYQLSLPEKVSTGFFKIKRSHIVEPPVVDNETTEVKQPQKKSPPISKKSKKEPSKKIGTRDVEQKQKRTPVRDRKHRQGNQHHQDDFESTDWDENNLRTPKENRKPYAPPPSPPPFVADDRHFDAEKHHQRQHSVWTENKEAKINKANKSKRIKVVIFGMVAFWIIVIVAIIVAYVLFKDDPKSERITTRRRTMSVTSDRYPSTTSDEDLSETETSTHASSTVTSTSAVTSTLTVTSKVVTTKSTI